MLETYLAINGNEIRYLGNGLKVKEFVDKGYYIYSESPIDGHQELVYDQDTEKYLKPVYIMYADGTVKVVADPEHGWIGV